MNTHKYVVLYVTASSDDEAERIATSLLEKKLVACVNIIPKVKSIYWWQKKIEQSDELLLVMKSVSDNVERIVTEVKSLHSYDVPEVISMPIHGGNSDYLDWISDSI